MRLYKMELYKLCCKKSLAAGLLFVLLLGPFFLWQNARYQTCSINGTTYYGFDAIQMNRQITEEFRGVLTDEKVLQIVERYGFPQKSTDFDNRLSGNFLNTFIADYVSNSYGSLYSDSPAAIQTIPLAETDLGRYSAAAGMEIRLEYYAGWLSFLDEFGILMLGVSMLILYAVSVVFSEEEQTGIKPLLFTTKEGPRADVLSKIAASFSVSAGIWLLAVSFYLLLYSAIYGTDGLHCIAGLITNWRFAYETPLILQPIGSYLAKLLLTTLLAVLELCAITICVSARSRSSFHAIVGAGICYTLPFLGYALFQSGTVLLTLYSGNMLTNSAFSIICWHILYLLRALIYSSPVYLMVGRDSLIELSLMRQVCEMHHIYIALMLAVLLLLLCTVQAWRQYRRIPSR